MNYCFQCMTRLNQPDGICPKCGHDNRMNTNGTGFLPPCILNDQYVIGKALGRGGFGITYLGLDTGLNRIIAVKEYFPAAIAVRDPKTQELHPLDDSVAEEYRHGIERVLREARVAVSLESIPNIVRVYGIFRANQTVYIAMEYIEGMTLKNYVRKEGGKLSWLQAWALLLPVMEALGKVHVSGVIHRDVSPDNIMIRGDGTPILLDFGTAQPVTSGKTSHSVTLRMGFAPLEQYSSSAPQDGRTDQYAMMATMYYVLTGSEPPSPLDGEPTLPSVLGADIPEGAEKVLMKGMSRRLEDRYPSMEALIEAFEHASSNEYTRIVSDKPEIYPTEVSRSAGKKTAGFEKNGFSEARTGSLLEGKKKDIPSGDNGKKKLGKGISVFGVFAIIVVLVGAVIWSRYVNKPADDTHAETVVASTPQVDSAELSAGANEDKPAEEMPAEPTASNAQGDPVALTAGVRMTGSAQGFAGNVTVDFALDDNLAIEGLTVSAPDEIEGLGKRVEEAEFAAQFNGKALPVSLKDIEVISGATITSSAVVDAINAAAPEAVEEPASMEADPNVLTAKAVGFSGEDVTVAITLDDAGAVASMTVDAATETAGLGQRAMEDTFTSQFIGKTGPFVLGENVDTVAGATITSTAVVDAVNSLLPANAAEEKPAAEPTEEAPAVGEALTVKTVGFSGEDVTVSITLNENGAVASMTVDAAVETAGLGQKVMEDAFTSQFIGKSGPFVLGENVDAITGATITSTAVVDAVNSLLHAASAEEKPAKETTTEPAAEAPAANALTAKARGFSGGDVTVSITLDDNGAIASMSVDAAAETEGLGQKAMEEAFTSQFIGKTGPFALGENVDAITGATITSTVVVRAVNSLLGRREAAALTTEEVLPTIEIDPEIASMKVVGVSGKDIIVAIKKDDSGAISFMTVDAAGESADRGQKTMQEAFISQFIGKTGPFVLGENVDAVTGATITSTIVVKAVNSLLHAATSAE